jgi:hypothetical protein
MYTCPRDALDVFFALCSFRLCSETQSPVLFGFWLAASFQKEARIEKIDKSAGQSAIGL